MPAIGGRARGGSAIRKKRVGLADTHLGPELLDSDEDDGDYDERAEKITTSPRKRVAAKGRKAPKKKKSKYDDDDDDEIHISDSELEDLGLSSESEARETDEEEDMPRTRTRRKQASYKEPDSDEDLEEISPSESERETVGKNRRRLVEVKEVNSHPATKSLAVIFRLPQEKLSEISNHPEERRRTTRASSRAASRAASTGPTSTQASASTTAARKNSRSIRQTSTGPVRKSSRLHPETPEPIQHLADDNKHAVIDEPPKHPSTVFEESEETNQSQPEVKSEAIPETIIRGTEEPEDAQAAGVDEPDHDTFEEDAPSAQAPEVHPEVVAVSDDDEDEDIQRPRRGTKRGITSHSTPPPTTDTAESSAGRATRRTTRLMQKRSPAKKGAEDTDDEFAPEDGDSGSDESEDSQPKPVQSEAEDDSERPARPSRRSPNKRSISDHDEQEELAEELSELRPSKRNKRQRTSAHVDVSGPTLRRRNDKPNYQLFPANFDPHEEPFSQGQQENRGLENRFKGRSLFSTAGPFGGHDFIAPILGDTSVNAMGYAGGADSDSSDDERPAGLGASPVMARGPLMGGGLAHGAPGADLAGTPANMGRIKPKAALLTDSDPLGVDKDIDFSKVGGLDDHINQLKDMVLLPLLYPEVFQKFGTTPPRGVLFHGPPGTGKTLLARALANDCSIGDQKITFFMRKGADVMSKWVGEAERQLRMLFEEARKNQPSIIFFDEIDGLAPVRSSKQEQIHASIVATLLALMDGMDGRGQVIVIGATNRPDSVDPALRRPGRFDREFYFPLPNVEARKKIIQINTEHWEPKLPEKVVNQLAEFTKGYGGADLRALCTEAALNAIQRRYPQIYKKKEKLLIDVNTIQVTPKDFMLAQKKIIPSSERATSSAGSPLPEHVQPLLQRTVNSIKALIDEILPRRKHLTVLEEAEFEDDDPDSGFDREMRMREFDSARIFRPRLLLYGKNGMGQSYIGPAILHHFEGFHVQSIDMASLYSDSSVGPEVTLINKFTEIKRHKPSVIFVQNIDMFFRQVSDQIVAIFESLLGSIPANDPILLLGVMNSDFDTEIIEGFDDMKRALFPFSRRNYFKIDKPDENSRFDFFQRVEEQLKMAPNDFPDPDNKNRKKRILEELPVAPPPPPKVITDEELHQLKDKDRATLYWLTFRLKPCVENSNSRMRKLRKGVVDQSAYPELFSGEPKEDSPYELITENGETKILEKATGKKFFNISLVTIEDRIVNGYYKTPDEFLEDCKRLRRDARILGEDRDRERWMKANEFLGNAVIHVNEIKTSSPDFIIDCENLAKREKIRLERRLAKQEHLRIEAAKATEVEDHEAEKSGETHQTNGIVDESNQTQDVGEVTVLDQSQLHSSFAEPPRGQSSPPPPEARASPATEAPTGMATALHDITGLSGVGSFRQESQADASQLEGSHVEHVEITHSAEVLASQPQSSQSLGVKSTQSTSQADSLKVNAGSNDESTGPSGESQSQTFNNQQLLQSRIEFRSQGSISAKQGSQQLTQQSEESLFEITTSRRVATNNPLPLAANPLNDSQGSQDLPSSADKRELNKSMDSNVSVDQPSGDTASNEIDRDSSDLLNDRGPPLDTSAFANSSGDSQLASTQSNSSSHDASSLQQVLSSPPGAAVASVVTERRMLTLRSGNSGNSAPNSQATSHPSQEHEFRTPAVPQHRLEAEDTRFRSIILKLKDKTEGFSVEQLEQVMATIMSTIWRYKNDANRENVGNRVLEAAEEVIEDIKEMQTSLEASMESQRSG
ncbi:AAA-domain-containing protein [Ascobolus immersus RN42]|uniref:AAA-domain-containing protein n=1 Tax=Ascobolus immersus RN42 TaxID=1160509 RepID=A0A3N4INU7_ASCIM|nr:AAA-domain-containing protein [Ascobolus immersus RN42]